MARPERGAAAQTAASAFQLGPTAARLHLLLRGTALTVTKHPPNRRSSRSYTSWLPRDVCVEICSFAPAGLIMLHSCPLTMA
jgi:hypothetical protein